MKKSIGLFILTILTASLFVGSCKEKVDITPHKIVPEADLLYNKALALASRYDSLEPVYRALDTLEAAIKIDSLNPTYYFLKSKLLLELGNLDSALKEQTRAANVGAMNGESWLQLGIFQAASLDSVASKKSLKKSVDYFGAVLAQYPDSFGAYYQRQIAISLIKGDDKLYMPDYLAVEKMFPTKKAEIESVRRIYPSKIVEEVMFVGVGQLTEENLK